MKFEDISLQDVREFLREQYELIKFLGIDYFLLKIEENEMYFLFNEGYISKKVGLDTSLKNKVSVNNQVGEIYGEKLIAYYRRAFNGETVKYKVRMKGIVFNTILIPCIENDSINYVLGVSKEITEIEKHKEVTNGLRRDLEIIRQRDCLVDVYSRATLLRILNKIMSRENTGKETQLSLILFDIDRFNHINDVYGHTIGDRVLVEIGQECSSGIRSTDYLGRWLGGQFMVISPNSTLEGAMHLAERLRQRIANHEFEKNIKLTASFGVVVVKSEASIDQIIWSVEKAMHKAKRLGKNTIVVDEN